MSFVKFCKEILQPVHVSKKDAGKQEVEAHRNNFRPHSRPRQKQFHLSWHHSNKGFKKRSQCSISWFWNAPDSAEAESFKRNVSPLQQASEIWLQWEPCIWWSCGGDSEGCSLRHAPRSLLRGRNKIKVPTQADAVSHLQRCPQISHTRLVPSLS